MQTRLTNSFITTARLISAQTLPRARREPGTLRPPRSRCSTTGRGRGAGTRGGGTRGAHAGVSRGRPVGWCQALGRWDTLSGSGTVPVAHGRALQHSGTHWRPVPAVPAARGLPHTRLAQSRAALPGLGIRPCWLAARMELAPAPGWHLRAVPPRHPPKGTPYPGCVGRTGPAPPGPPGHSRTGVLRSPAPAFPSFRRAQSAAIIALITCCRGAGRAPAKCEEIFHFNGVPGLARATIYGAPAGDLICRLQCPRWCGEVPGGAQPAGAGAGTQVPTPHSAGVAEGLRAGDGGGTASWWHGAGAAAAARGQALLAKNTLTFPASPRSRHRRAALSTAGELRTDAGSRISPLRSSGAKLGGGGHSPGVGV